MASGYVPDPKLLIRQRLLIANPDGLVNFFNIGAKEIKVDYPAVMLRITVT
jgi:hypothetical protein